MSQAMASGKIRIDDAGLDKVRLRMAELEKPDTFDKRGKKCWTEEYLKDQTFVSLSTVKRFLKGIGVGRDSTTSILKALGFEPINFIAQHDSKLQNSKRDPQPNIAIDWQRVCQEMLHEQQEEQRFRRRATEMGFEVNVFVPLGLMERKQQQRRSGNVPMELLHQLEPEVVTRIYEHDEFMTHVIGQNPTGKNKHIAIVGEPGAGKTTLLDKIATHIHENNQDWPICIALASLQGKTLKDYILQEWLPEAMALVYPDIDIEKSHKTSLQKRLRHGGVWLLLDGVDEMAVGANSCLSLEEIRNQLTDWLGNVRVVLTCRTNVWDARLNNPLTGFDTYKTQEFKPPQVDNFIQQWFAEAKNIQRGQELQKKLQQPQKERIRQLVKNPLRLSLLCQLFSKNKKVELPETKAELYQHFVCYFYEWKPSQLVIDWATQLGLREELHQALGRLSLAGLDSDTRFRLSLSLIEKEMGDRLFKLAWDLGWLNLVDRESATDEPVYAFFHPTFQEYFASLVIDNCQFFMDRYRIFENQWLEVAILWLENSQISTVLKKELIDTITNLKKDKWKNMYRLKLLPLNIVYSCQSGDIEFIIGRVYFVCSDDNIQTKVYKLMLPGYEEFIIESLKYYAPKEACDIISQVINNNTDLELYEQSRLLEVLFKINPEHQCLKVSIPKLLKDDREGRAIEVAKIALKHDNFKQIAVDFLVNALLNEDEQYELQNISIINVLMDSKILDKGVIGKLISFKLFNSEEIALAKIKQTNFEVTDKIIEIIQTNKDYMLRHICIKVLLMETFSKQSIIEELVNLILNLKDSQIQWFIADELQQITHKPQLQRLVFGLKDYVEDAVAKLDNDLYIIVYSLLWHCANHLSYTEFYDACCVQPSCTDLEALENISVANSSTAQYLNIVEQLSVLQSAVSHNEELDRAVQLICIDGSEFNPPDNPATDIYIQMVEQGCPERQEGTPTTMPLLKAYWRLNLRNLGKRIALVFYNSKIDREFSEPFLTALSAFGGTIAIITDRPCDNVKRISPNHPNLIDAVLKWLQRSILEA
ncbi:NACHT C-terminal alpha/beta 1 domain-containing protein [Microcoleus sp. D3_18_C4]|uniref:NACHT C-terminal alpha/beta 1 domain-containing protein n=1 Tax=Microcoleus sp. D3_18_C4 TaxID=3055335 RepID=UPI002FD39B65